MTLTPTQHGVRGLLLCGGVAAYTTLAVWAYIEFGGLVFLFAVLYATILIPVTATLLGHGTQAAREAARR